MIIKLLATQQSRSFLPQREKNIDICYTLSVVNLYYNIHELFNFYINFNYIIQFFFMIVTFSDSIFKKNFIVTISGF